MNFMIALHGNLDYKKQIDKPISLNNLVSHYPIITQKEPSNTRTFLNSIMKSNDVDFHPQFDIVSYNLVKDFAKIAKIINSTKENKLFYKTVKSIYLTNYIWIWR